MIIDWGNGLYRGTKYYSGGAQAWDCGGGAVVTGNLLCGSVLVAPLLVGTVSVSALLLGEVTVTPLLSGEVEISVC